MVLAKREEGRVSANEVRSWRNSLQYMRNVVDDNAIPDDAGVALEYRIPQTSKRIDFILTGRGRAPDRQEAAVIVEFKQWEEVWCTDKDAIVRTYLGGGTREVPPPLLPGMDIRCSDNRLQRNRAGRRHRHQVMCLSAQLCFTRTEPAFLQRANRTGACFPA